MSTRRHMPADDFDGDHDRDASGSRKRPKAAAAPKAPEPKTARRRIRSRRLLAEEGEKEELIVDCPHGEEWPTFEKCLQCERFRGYSLDPTGQSSFVSCARGERDPAAIPSAAGGCAERTRVTAIMSDPFCVGLETTLDELASIFVDKKISGLPVVDADGKPVGVVSKTDLIEAQAGHMVLEEPEEPAPKKRPRTARGKKLARGFQEERRSLLTVRELMTPVVFTVDETATVADAASIMAAKRIHRLPVVARSGHVVGVITALDVARWVGGRSPDATAKHNVSGL